MVKFIIALKTQEKLNIYYYVKLCSNSRYLKIQIRSPL